MAIDITDTEPARIRAGDTITWRKCLRDYPASAGWTLYYRLINSAGKFDITATADGETHLVSVPPATSDDYTAGDYTLLSWVSNGTDRVSLPTLKITILQNLAVAIGGVDTRSHAKKMLDAIDAALLSLSSGERLAVVQAEAAARNIRYDFAGLQKLRKLYAAAVRGEEDAERVAAGLAPRNRINVRF